MKRIISSTKLNKADKIDKILTAYERGDVSEERSAIIRALGLDYQANAYDVEQKLKISDERVIDKLYMKLGKSVKASSFSGVDNRKRAIKASRDDAFTFLQKFIDRGIDVTLCKYGIEFESPDAYEEGTIEHFKFSCTGNYLAYLAMCFYEAPTADSIDAYFDSVDNMLAQIPDEESMREFAAEEWGEPHGVIMLKNLTTNEVLYSAEV